MARTKTPPPPLFSVKGQFVESLDHTLQMSIMLLQAAEFAVKHCAFEDHPHIKAELEKAVKNYRAAIMSDE